MKVVAPHLDLEECREGAHHEFVVALHARAARAGWYADSWPFVADRLVFSVCPVDTEHKMLLRTLRVDFDGTTVWYGPDETGQFEPYLDPSRPDVHVLALSSASAMADAAADWIEAEVDRPIIRREWQHAGRTHYDWVLEDTGQPIVATLGLRNLGETTRMKLVSGRRRSTAG